MGLYTLSLTKQIEECTQMYSLYENIGIYIENQ